MTRVLLVDDHRLLRDGLRALLQAAAIEVVGEAADGRTALRLAVELVPDVVVMDIGLPDLSGIEVTRQLATAAPGVHVLALSMHADRRSVADMLEAGALGYLHKDAGIEELVRGIESVARRQVYLGAGIADLIVGEYLQLRLESTRPARPALTPRERDVLKLIAEGQCTKAIAASLGVSVKTVETFRRQLMEKLGVDSIAGLTKYAVRTGLVSAG